MSTTALELIGEKALCALISNTWLIDSSLVSISSYCFSLIQVCKCLLE